MRGCVLARATVEWWGLLCREHDEQGKRQSKADRWRLGKGLKGEDISSPIGGKARVSLFPPTSLTLGNWELLM